jgi:hypothetical protein
MSDYGRYPRGQGFAWRGDWSARLLELLQAKGFSSLTSYAGTMPLAPFAELVASLGEGDVAPVQLKWRLVKEARASNTLRECAQDLLVRFLRGNPRGWPSDLSWHGQSDVRSALITWQLSFDDAHHDALLSKITGELLAATDIPPGWLPSGVDDPRIVSLFDKFWPAGEP